MCPALIAALASLPSDGLWEFKCAARAGLVLGPETSWAEAWAATMDTLQEGRPLTALFAELTVRTLLPRSQLWLLTHGMSTACRVEMAF